MEDKDLIKKLENIELPEIEIQSHKRRLRIALINSDYFLQKSNFLEIFKKSLAFAIPALVLLIVFGITTIQPRLIEAKALRIARSNPEIRKLMEEKGMVLSEVKVIDGKAYVLLNPLEEPELIEGKTPAIKIQKAEEDEIEDMEVAIVEVNLEQKEVAKINPIKWEDIAPLVNKEKESAKEIVETEEILEQIIPEGAKIEKVQSSLPKKLLLVEKDNEVEVVPHPQAKKRAQIHFVLDGKKWVIQVNLVEKRIEKIQYSSGNSNLKGRE